MALVGNDRLPQQAKAGAEFWTKTPATLGAEDGIHQGFGELQRARREKPGGAELREHRFQSRGNPQRLRTVLDAILPRQAAVGSWQPLAPSGGPAARHGSGWKDLIDAEALKRAVYTDRLFVTRPPVRL